MVLSGGYGSCPVEKGDGVTADQNSDQQPRVWGVVCDHDSIHAFHPRNIPNTAEVKQAPRKGASHSFLLTGSN